MTDLSAATLAAGLPAGIVTPGYDRAAVRPGIAHLSVGNFHRAHLALYVDRCLHRAGQSQWGILGIGVVDDDRERAKAAAAGRQQGLYTLTECPPEGEPDRRVVGSIVDYIHAPADPAAAIRRMADPAIRIVSLTITEGGYKPDAAAADHDRAHPEAPRSVFGLIVAALRHRRAADTPPFTVMSCDNLQHNGAVCRAAVVDYARAISPGTDLADWIDTEVAFPASMVDRITPAVTPADARRLDAASGIDDGWPIFAEDFIQWVVEDDFPTGRPEFDAVGVQFTTDVAAYEQVKLRMLNGSHVTLAYPAILLGHRIVHEAMRDDGLRQLLGRFMTDDVMPLLAAPPGMPLDAYRDKLLERFTNPAIGDQIARLCLDGAAKLPVYILPTLAAALERGRDTSRIAFMLACYVRHLAGRDDHGQSFTPAEPNLTDADRALATSGDPLAALRMSFLQPLQLDTHPTFAPEFARTLAALETGGVRPLLAALG